MNKPLFPKSYSASEYHHLFKIDNMNFYSAKMDEDLFVVVDDYDADCYDIWSEVQIVSLENDRLLCMHDGKYGVVSLEGWDIIPFVYDKFEKRVEANKNRYNVLLGNRWGVVDSSGKEIFRIKYNNPIPIVEPLKSVSNNMLCRSLILVEDADTLRKGLVDFDGREVIPTIYSKIERSGNWDYVYVNFGAMEETDPDSTLNGIWGCYDWQGKEIIPVKYHAIHYNNGYFIAGDDECEYGNCCEFNDRYYGTYDLYDLYGSMIIGGFNNCRIRTNYFIFYFGIVVKSYWKTNYFLETDFECGEELVKELICDKMCSVVVDKDLRSFIPRHLINETREEIEYEIFLCNHLPIGEGLLIGETPKLDKGKRYSDDDKIIKGCSIRSAYFINDSVVVYCTNEKKVMADCSEVRLKGIIFCNERMVIAPTYKDIRSMINNGLLFVQNENGLVGIRNVEKELLEPQFDLITNPYDNIAIGFKIKCIEEAQYQCQCFLMNFDKDTIRQEEVAKITGSELYDLLYPSNILVGGEVPNLLNYRETLNLLDGWSSFDMNDKHKALIAQYWKHIPRNYGDDSFWYPGYKDFHYLGEIEYDEEESLSDDSVDACDWRYYDDGLDMDQQDERFYDF